MRHLATLLAACLLAPGAALAHHGHLHKDGCHEGKNGGYHCHKGRLAGMHFDSRDSMLKELHRRQAADKKAAKK
jgi:hypothetical protein